MLRRVFCFTVVTVLLVAANVSAQPVVQVTTNYVGSFLDDFTIHPNHGGFPLDFPIGPPSNVVDPTDIHQFDVFVELLGAGPTDDFQSVLFDITLTTGFSPDTSVGGQSYFPLDLLFDPPGPPPPTSIFTANEDGGTSVADLKEISVVTHVQAAPLIEPGESGPFQVGFYYLNFSTTFPQFVGIAPHGSDPATIWRDGESLSLGIEGFVAGDPFMVTPEPASVALLLSLGGAALLRRRRV